MVPDEKSSVEQALDLILFAPVGLAMTARTQLPEMVAKGRAQIEGQVTMARFIGQFAVKQGKAEVEKRLKAYTDRPQPPPDPSPPPAVPEGSAATAPVTVQAEMASPAVAAPDEASGPPPTAGELAIPGYDALSASQVVQRLAGLSSIELEQVRLYEASTRGRKTVLTKISQLQ